MSDQNGQSLLSEKEEERREEGDNADDASEQDMRIEVSETTQRITTTTSQESAIEPIVM
jgi:hypothetical protein